MKILVVGAGFAGSVIARELAEEGHQITLIDTRDHVGGNAGDTIDPDTGIRRHLYGPHIFHTSNMKVVEWLSKFTEWEMYDHKVKALLDDGRYATLPVNRETKQMVGEENVVDIFIRPYTKKMWDKDIEELDPSILKRVPIRDDNNELYFPNDSFCAMPKHGYTAMFERILDHENIEVRLNTTFVKTMETQYDHIFNSMPIDVYFDCCLGELPYRSLKFHTLKVPGSKLQPTPTINFTHDGPITRMTEWQLYPGHGENKQWTLLTYEEPCDYKDNDYQRYYPVKDIDGKNREIYEQYKAMIPENVTFIGRCGLYVYVDMDMACNSALAAARKFISKP